MPVKTCPNCGAAVSMTDIVCPACGIAVMSKAQILKMVRKESATMPLKGLRKEERATMALKREQNERPGIPLPECPQCGRPVSRMDIVCPACGARVMSAMGIVKMVRSVFFTILLLAGLALIRWCLFGWVLFE